MRLDQLEAAQGLARERDHLREVRAAVAKAYPKPGDRIAFMIDLLDGRSRTIGMEPKEVLDLLDDRLRAVDGRLVTMGVELPAEPGT